MAFHITFRFLCYLFRVLIGCVIDWVFLGIAIVSVAEEGCSRVLARCGGPGGRCRVLGSEELVGRLVASSAGPLGCSRVLARCGPEELVGRLLASSAGPLFAGPSGHRRRCLWILLACKK